MIFVDQNCFYCVEYNKIYPDYPINKAVFNEFNDFTPRCNLHWQYYCNSCDKLVHFNGIAYCEGCDVYTCVKCGEESLEIKEFFFYDYYYAINCKSCSVPHPTLDYLEFINKHPVQLGNIALEHPVNLWKSDLTKNGSQIEQQQKPWGSNRITSFSRNNVQLELEEGSINSREMWNIKAEKWTKYIGEEGDFHHRENILPVMFKLLDLESYQDPTTVKILDVACGTGNVARKIAKMGFNVSGVDYSENMLATALAKNKEFNLQIDYKNINASKVLEVYDKESFDLIYCNMALMDLEELEVVISSISTLLKKHGIFIFSISHPIFSWPTAQTIRLPKDSQRGEDKIWVFDTYYRKKTLVKLETMEDSFLYYTRTISTYVNECIKNGLQILEMVEPKPTWEQIKKYPREHFFDDDRRPDFLMIKTKKVQF